MGEMGREEWDRGGGYTERNSESSWIIPTSWFPKSWVFTSKTPLKPAYFSLPPHSLPWSRSPCCSPRLVPPPLGPIPVLGTSFSARQAFKKSNYHLIYNVFTLFHITPFRYSLWMFHRYFLLQTFCSQNYFTVYFSFMS